MSQFKVAIFSPFGVRSSHPGNKGLAPPTSLHVPNLFTNDVCKLPWHSACDKHKYKLNRSASQARPAPNELNTGGQAKKQDVGSGGGKQNRPGGGAGGSLSSSNKPGSLGGNNNSVPGSKGTGGGRRRRGGGGGQPSKQHANPPSFHQKGGRVGGGRRGDGRQRDPPPSLNTEAELGSLYQPGSRKQNLSHLLTNFQVGPPRGSRGGRQNGGSRRSGPMPTQIYTPAKPRYSAQHYLQATCQFVLSDSADLVNHTIDPDAIVDWDVVEQVVLKQGGSEPTACPICLFPPNAAKLTLCGHVYCWPCILHYLALSDDSSRKCPICDHMVAREDLRSVVVVPQPDHCTGATIEMRLMKRDRESLIAVPADSDLDTSLFPAVADAGPNRRFIKMFTASAAEVGANILARERKELEEQWTKEGSQPEGCFIQEALALLAKREEVNTLKSSLAVPKERPPQGPEKVEYMQDEVKVMSETKDNVDASKVVVDPFAEEENEVPGGADCENNENIEAVGGHGIDEKQMVLEQVGEKAEEARARYSSGESGGSFEEEEQPEVRVEDLDISEVQSKPGKRQTFYFYQASDGQPIFLHALNVQMLVTEFGSLENCPSTIKAQILEKDSSSMTTDLRDRLRYLRHLPVCTAFEVAELDISNLVSRATLGQYAGQLEERHRRRGKRAREEKRREKKIHLEERRLMGRYPSPMARIESRYHYPEVGQVEEFPGVGDLPDNDEEAKEENNEFTFAKALAHRPAAPVAVLPKSSSSPSGWAVLGQQPPVPQRREDPDSEPEPEGYVPPPQPTSLGDALAAALAATTVSGSSGGKKKGKRGKALLLGGPPRPML